MNVTGGFANQLFRFACGYQISKKFNQEMILHIYDKRSYVDAFLLDELCIPDCKKVYMRVGNDSEKAAEALGFREEMVIDETNFENLGEDCFSKNILVYVDAPFQKTIYFDSCLNEIRDMFQLKNLSDEMSLFKQKLQNQNSVAIHVRRRDFVDMRNANGEQSADDFYKAAIAYFRKNVEQPVFYVFSDDISYCIDFFGNKDDIYFVKIPGGKDADMEEFFCISWCRHRILTRGSSFGRMADVLNGDSRKMTVYQGNDENKGHIIYLNEESIKNLCETYNDSQVIEREKEIANGSSYKFYDCNKKFEKNILSIYLEKVKKQYENYQLEYAEQTLIKAWQYAHNNRELHKYYFKVLCGLYKREEALIEAVAYLKCGGEKKEVIEEFTSIELDKIEAFLKKEEQKFVIIPKEPYRNAELNQLCNLGILIQRIGYKVFFIFHKAKEGDGGNIAANNEILMSNYMYTNCEGYMYQSKMYDFDIIKKQYNLDQFIESITGDKPCYVISDDVEILEQCRSRTLKKVYWEAVNTYRYYHGKIKPIMESLPEVDWIVSDEKKSGQTDRHIVINRIPLFFNTDKKISLSEQYAYDKELFYVIEQLILR